MTTHSTPMSTWRHASARRKLWMRWNTRCLAPARKIVVKPTMPPRTVMRLRTKQILIRMTGLWAQKAVIERSQSHHHDVGGEYLDRFKFGHNASPIGRRDARDRMRDVGRARHTNRPGRHVKEIHRATVIGSIDHCGRRREAWPNPSFRGCRRAEGNIMARQEHIEVAEVLARLAKMEHKARSMIVQAGEVSPDTHGQQKFSEGELSALQGVQVLVRQIAGWPVEDREMPDM